MKSIESNSTNSANWINNLSFKKLTIRQPCKLRSPTIITHIYYLCGVDIVVNVLAYLSKPCYTNANLKSIPLVE